MAGFVIVVDIGNTSTTLGLAAAGRISGGNRLPTRTARRADVSAALERLVRNRPIAGAMLCSVVPERNNLWLQEMRIISGRTPLMVHWRLKLGLQIKYPAPATIGADRLANACGASHRYGSPVIVADFGTALTFDVVADNAYLGGIIVPGLPLMTDYLAEKTALLPHLSLEKYRGIPHDCRGMPTIGKSTRQAMAIGARLGYLGMVREIFTRLSRTLKSEASRGPDSKRSGRGIFAESCEARNAISACGKPQGFLAKKDRSVCLCATGGYAAWALAGCDLPVRIDPDLTLFGIARIYELNTGRENMA